MKVIGLDEKEYNLNFIVNSSVREKVSSYHQAARTLIKSMFPMERVYEEVTLPGTSTQVNKKALYADFFIPNLRIVIEVQGEQHYLFSPFFHNSKKDFYLSLARDRDKKEFCRINGFTLIELPYTENIDEWRQRISSRE